MKKKILSVIVILVSTSILGILSVVFREYIYGFERGIYGWWISRTLPEPTVFQVDLSRRTVLQITPNAEDISWLGTYWTDDGKYITVSDSPFKLDASNIMVIDPQNPTYSNNVYSIDGEKYFDLVNELPFTLGVTEFLLGACQTENLFFTAKNIENHMWETRLWRGEQLIKTFQPVEFRLTYASGFREKPVALAVEASDFSRDCHYLSVHIDHRTWILDTISQTFTLLPFENTPWLSEHIFGAFEDYSYDSAVYPVWSPTTDHEFVFESNGGAAKYDILTNEYSWLVAPNNNISIDDWSKTGHWILGYFDESMSVFSPDGDKIGILESCADLGDPSKDILNLTRYPAWSPTEDKFAFICSPVYYEESCGYRYCEEKRFLIIWDLSNLGND